MTRTPLKIESVLERLSSMEAPEDPVHRYELRRELLCSRFFQDHCARQERWNRLMTFTAPLITGGFLVVVFSLVSSSIHESAEMPPVISTVVVAQSEQEFIDTREPVPVYEVMKFVPVQAVDYVFMR